MDKPKAEFKENTLERDKFPGVLWLLPICFGLLGGIIAAFIASMKYKASWIELFLVGLIIFIGSVAIYWLLIFGMFRVI